MAGVLAVSTLQGFPAQASGEALHLIFAGCAGRMSAYIEHGWLTGENGAQQALQDKKRTFVSLFEATRPLGDARAAFHHRVAAKMAQAALLTTASFAQDPLRAETARITAEAQMATCRRLLLDS